MPISTISPQPFAPTHSELEHDPERLAQVDERLHLIRQLRRKYGATIEEILDAADRFESELSALTLSREEQERLENEQAQVERDLAKAAEALSAKRKIAAEKFAKGLRGTSRGTRDACGEISGPN